MKLLIIGNANSIHIYNQIRYNFKYFRDAKISILDLNFNKQSNFEAYDYYRMNKIEIISCVNKGINNKLLQKIMHLFMPIYKLNVRKKRYDLCVVESIDILRVIIALLIQKKCRKMVAVFWGSDLLQNKYIRSCLYKTFLNDCDKIVLNTEHMKSVFNKTFKEKYNKKIWVVKLPTDSFEQIDTILSNKNKKEIRNELHIPDNKVTILLCHSATANEQLDKILASIQNYRDITNCYFIFLMTYGDNSKNTYIEMARNFLSVHHLEGIILNDYLPRLTNLKYIICTNIYISMLKTDAFSGVMQEILYCGGVYIYGKWLDYVELKEFETIPIDSFAKLDNALNEAMEKLKNQALLDKNKRIRDISSGETIRSKWCAMLDMETRGET